MGSNQLSSRSGNGHLHMSKSLDFSTLTKPTFEDLKTYTIMGVQFGTNPLVNNSIVLGENDNNSNTSSTVIGFHNGIGGLLADVLGVGKNNCVHCFCFLEMEELIINNEGIVIEFGEYEYGDGNDFKVETFYTSKKGGLRLYVVKTDWFENYCSLTRVRCSIKKREILEDVLIGISQRYKWRLEFYDNKKQNCHDFVAVLLNYLQVKNYEICKGSFNMIPDKIKDVL